mmetsp:Transcript_41445/g.76320  ORF Transcript_41445/g.76320 Transcript_41445/m.76320 type:complete len:229 (+) Transcript_41445:425-1111(+)
MRTKAQPTLLMAWESMTKTSTTSPYSSKQSRRSWCLTFCGSRPTNNFTPPFSLSTFGRLSHAPLLDLDLLAGPRAPLRDLLAGTRVTVRDLLAGPRRRSADLLHGPLLDLLPGLRRGSGGLLTRLLLDLLKTPRRRDGDLDGTARLAAAAAAARRARLEELPEEEDDEELLDELPLSQCDLLRLRLFVLLALLRDLLLGSPPSAAACPDEVATRMVCVVLPGPEDGDL